MRPHRVIPLENRAHWEPRFWKKVNKNTATDCWLWTGTKPGAGYGWFGIEAGYGVLAHRLAYTLLVGPIEQGKHLLHSCDTPACVNPAHLRPGTDQENHDDKAARRRHPGHSQTACKHGHPYTPENTIFHSVSGARMCRVCKVLKQLKRRDANQARPDYQPNKARNTPYLPSTLKALEAHYATGNH